MQMPDTVKLIAEEQPHGVWEEPKLEEREVYCLVRSVGMSERYQAMANGFNPSVVFTLRDSADYQGEKNLIFRGKLHRVIRTYQTGRAIELTCEELTTDAAVMDEYGGSV